VSFHHSEVVDEMISQAVQYGLGNGVTQDEINQCLKQWLDQDTGEEVEHDEEPNEAMAIALYEEATRAGLAEDGGPWNSLATDWQNKWRTLAAKAHEAYHRAYEQRVQTYPVT
jgi:hypothetical protein